MLAVSFSIICVWDAVINIFITWTFTGASILIDSIPIWFWDWNESFGRELSLETSTLSFQGNSFLSLKFKRYLRIFNSTITTSVKKSYLRQRSAENSCSLLRFILIPKNIWSWMCLSLHFSSMKLRNWCFKLKFLTFIFKNFIWFLREIFLSLSFHLI